MYKARLATSIMKEISSETVFALAIFSSLEKSIACLISQTFKEICQGLSIIHPQKNIGIKCEKLLGVLHSQAIML